LIFLAIVPFTFSQKRVDNDFKVAVTTRNVVSKQKAKPHGYRIHLAPYRDSLAVLGFGFQRFPTSIRKLRFPELNIKINRSMLENFTDHSLDSVFQFLTPIKKDLSYPLMTTSEYQKTKQRFLNGGRGSPYFTNQWIRISVVPDPENKFITVRSQGIFKTHHVYWYDLLPGATAHELVALDPWHCEPANVQLFKLRKLAGYGVSKIKYRTYEETRRVILRPAFEVYFPHNETKPDPVGIENVIKYLDQNTFVILNALLEGGCSIEGDSVKNSFLQQERAHVLQRTLRRYTDELLKKDTVTLTDPMAQFRELVRSTQLKYLDTLNNRELKSLVNENSDIRASLEPIFILQRKASLKLVVAKRLTKGEQFEKFRNDFQKITSKLTGNGAARIEAEARTMGMIEKLFQYYEQGYVSKSGMDDLFNETDHPDYLRVLVTYHFLKQYESQSWPREIGKSWDDYWLHYDVLSYLKQAQLSLISLAEFESMDRKKYVSMLVDLQAYTYEFVQNGLIPVSNLCEMPYPEKKEFMGLILNQYAYLYEFESKSEHSGHFVYCLPPRNKRKIHNKDSVISTDQFLENIESEYGYANENHTSIRQKFFKQKSFDESQKGAYYFLLKQYYAKKNTSILDHVTTSDDNGSAFTVFNLWHFLAITIDRWDPTKNFFYDRDVQLTEMDRLIAVMKKSDAGLCKPQINSLYLEYHLKMLHYLAEFQEPGNASHTKFAESSLKFIADYYKTRKAQVNSKFCVYLLKQFNLLNTLPGSRPGAWYAYDLLHSIAQHRLLNDEEIKLYAHYLRLFNPSFKKLPLIYDRERLVKLAAEVF
jgi:hypothetical protein